MWRVSDGAVTDLDATLTQRCGAPDAPTAHGEVHFHH
jgi:hypothetical protein